MRVLIKTVAGSHLFGTNTPTSDKDFKGVYVPTGKQILLGSYDDAINQTTGNNDTRNTAGDVDVELYSVRKFLKMLKNGDTAAIEMLFTPNQYVLEKHPRWQLIRSQRDKLVSKKITGIIGYCRQQANKYGIKGSRMGELNNFIQFLKGLEKNFNFPNPKFKHAWPEILTEVKKYDHVHEIELKIKAKEESTVPAIDVLGKKFDHNCTFAYTLEILKKIYKNYGQRAREAKNNNGVDWKALSHAVRVMHQGIELLETGRITLPHSGENLKEIMDIKLGRIHYSKVSERIEELMLKLEKVSLNSKLPEQVDDAIIEEIITNLHHVEVAKQYG